MSYMISDGDFSVGIQLLDPNHDYATLGPYRAVEGDSAAAKLRNPNTNVAATVASRQRTNPINLSCRSSQLSCLDLPTAPSMTATRLSPSIPTV